MDMNISACKRVGVSIASTLSLLAPSGSMLTQAPLLGGATALVAATASTSAFAQENKRICGVVYTKNGRTIGWMQEVNKLTAAASCNAFKDGVNRFGIAAPLRNAGYTDRAGWHKADFGPSSCEAFTKAKLNPSNFKWGDVCQHMQEGQTYTFGNGRITG